MPFITGEARRMTDNIGPKVVGDICFLHYRKMLRAWRTSPRWTTAHDLYRDLIVTPRLHDAAITDGFSQRTLDEVSATELAWQVFFIKHVWPYEQMKCTENGEIDY